MHLSVQRPIIVCKNLLLVSAPLGNYQQVSSSKMRSVQGIYILCTNKLAILINCNSREWYGYSINSLFQTLTISTFFNLYIDNWLIRHRLKFPYTLFIVLLEAADSGPDEPKHIAD